MPSAVVPMEVRLLAELETIQCALAKLNQTMVRIAETLERAALRR
jgi:hypothetical protein